MVELRQLRKIAEANGFTVEQSKGSHWIFRDPKGRRVAVAANSASDTRSLKNTIAHLRAAGLPIPHKGGRATKRGTNQ